MAPLGSPHVPWLSLGLAGLLACGTSTNETGAPGAPPEDDVDARVEEPAPDGGATPGVDAAHAPDAGRDGGGVDGGAEPPATFGLNVLSLNSWSNGTDVVAADILALDADVVGLQEVTPAEVAQIVAILGEGWTFVQEDRSNTFAIVSRLPILARIGVTADTRGGIGATVAVSEHLRVHLFTTHLMYTPYGPYQLKDGMSVEDVVASEERVRMPALRELLAMSESLVAGNDPTFLVGDFNAPSHLDYEPAMPWPTSVAPIEAGFVDSYAELHADNPKKWAGMFAIDDPGITWSQLASSEPEGCFDRIDFVYYSRDDAVTQESREVNVASSDHRAVFSRFLLREPVRERAATNGRASTVSRHALLTFTPGKGAISSKLVLEGAGTSSTMELTGSSLQTELLAPDTDYTWQVFTVTSQGVEVGERWAFRSAALGGLAPNARIYAPGAVIEIAFDGGDAARDWIGLYTRRAAYGAGLPALSWKYLNDSTSAPGSPVTEGRLTLIAPSEAGEYVLRFFDDDGYGVEDELTIVVQ